MAYDTSDGRKENPHCERSLLSAAPGWNLNAGMRANRFGVERQAGFSFDLQLALIHTAVIQPRTIFLVHARNVVNEPVVQEAEEIIQVHGLTVLQPGGELLEVRQLTLVRDAVLSQTGEAVLR